MVPTGSLRDAHHPAGQGLDRLGEDAHPDGEVGRHGDPGRARHAAGVPYAELRPALSLARPVSLVSLDADMLAVIAAQRLCFAATVTPEGRPNLSPQGTVRVWDAHPIFFFGIPSPGTACH